MTIRRFALSALCAVLVGLFIWAVDRGGFAVDLFISLSSASIAFALLRKSTGKTIRKKVFAVVVAYISLMLVFGAIYHGLFLSAPEDAFQFAASIHEGRAHQVFLERYNEVLDFNERLYFLALVDSHPERAFEILRDHKYAGSIKGITNSGSDVEQIDKGYFIRFSETQYPMPPAGSAHDRLIQIWGEGKRIVFGGTDDLSPEVEAVDKILGAKTVADFRVAERDLQSEIAGKRNGTIALLRENVSKQTDWPYMDFCYFSAMTMTTVGYGDIIPSSPLSRAVVLAHAILGVLYIGFALSFLWPES
jgi:ion channel